MPSTKSLNTLAGCVFIFWWVAAVGAFSSSPNRNTISTSRRQLQTTTSFAAQKFNDVSSAQEVDGWTSLTDGGGVKLKVISSSSLPDAGAADKLDLKGKDVTVEYIGSIAARNWSAQDVIDCWLPDQGLSSLAPELFEAFDIDYKRLTNPNKFGIKFIKEGLGILKDAKQTTLFEAAQELKRSEESHMEGTVFDKNQFTFRPGKGQVIRAFDLAIAEMKVGQTVSVVARCDFAYGSKGLRVGGKDLVPPYATVQYDITLVEIK
ncbi:hypothetical protein ACHAWT_000625 [Skeletonema menzelii]